MGKDEIRIEIDSPLQCSGGFENSALLLQDGGLKNVIGEDSTCRRLRLVQRRGLLQQVFLGWHKHAPTMKRLWRRSGPGPRGVERIRAASS